LSDIRKVVEEMNIDVKWTMVADAFEHRESMEIDRKLVEDSNFNKQWIENQKRYQPEIIFDEDEEIQ
jgi:predicted XRE-type DNA-binding protein